MTHSTRFCCGCAGDPSGPDFSIFFVPGFDFFFTIPDALGSVRLKRAELTRVANLERDDPDLAFMIILRNPTPPENCQLIVYYY